MKNKLRILITIETAVNCVLIFSVPENLVNIIGLAGVIIEVLTLGADLILIWRRNRHEWHS